MLIIYPKSNDVVDTDVRVSSFYNVPVVNCDEDGNIYFDEDCSIDREMAESGLRLRS
jgi:hypothetical protein